MWPAAPELSIGEDPANRVGDEARVDRDDECIPLGLDQLADPG